MRPIDAMLSRAQGFTRFHMPGHKGRLGAIPSELDMTELWNTDDLYAPTSGIRRAEELLAQSAGAGASMLLSGGATSGIHASILSALFPGDRLLLSRDAHHSAFSGCVLAGVEPEAVHPAADFLSAIEKSAARAVLVTYPDYYGNCPDLGAIARAAHSRGMKVLVDAAHGAHFHWWDRPLSAVRLGADFSVESAHKTLGCLTGGAWLHLKNPQNAPRAREMLRLSFSSSPSFLILRSLDNARAWMDENGTEALRRLMQMCAAFRQDIASIPGLRMRSGGDPTRLTLDVSGLGLTGWEAYAQLRDRGLALEMADFRRVVAISTVFDREEDFSRLLAGLRALQGGAGTQEAFPPAPVGIREMPLREAALSPSRTVPLERATGKIAARAVGAYPPGWPAILPGERFTGEVVAFLAQMRAMGATLFGLEGDAVSIVEKGEIDHAV